jgi:hypothetical protein
VRVAAWRAYSLSRKRLVKRTVAGNILGGQKLPMENGVTYLFRGTTVGFTGSIFPRIGLTSTSVDPVVATLFATTVSKHGQSIVHIIPVARFASRISDNRSSNRLAELEGEFVIAASPEEIAACSVSVFGDVARKILEELGVVFPLNIYNLPDLSDALRLTRRLSREEILAFVRSAEERKC